MHFLHVAESVETQVCRKSELLSCWKSSSARRFSPGQCRSLHPVGLVGAMVSSSGLKTKADELWITWVFVILLSS